MKKLYSALSLCMVWLLIWMVAFEADAQEELRSLEFIGVELVPFDTQTDLEAIWGIQPLTLPLAVGHLMPQPAWSSPLDLPTPPGTKHLMIELGPDALEDPRSTIVFEQGEPVGTASLVTDEDGGLHGRFSAGNQTFTISPNSMGIPVVFQVTEDRPDPSADASEPEIAQLPGCPSLTLANPGFACGTQIQPTPCCTTGCPPKPPETPEIPLIDVLFVFSPNSVATIAAKDRQVEAEAKVKYLNLVLCQSGVKARLRAQAAELPDFVESPPQAGNLATYLTTAAAKLRALRNDADLVIFVVQEPKTGGRVLQIMPTEDCALAVVTAGGFHTGLVTRHELGHLLGGSHEQGSLEPPVVEFGQGFVKTGAFRTILGVGAHCGCSQDPRFSNPRIARAAGVPLGDANHDNACVMSHHASTVAGFRPKP